MTRYIEVAVWLAFLLLQPLRAVAGDDERKSDVLSFVRQALVRYGSLELRATARGQHPSGDGRQVTSVKFLTIKRGGPRAFISIKEIVDRPGDETWRLHKEYVICENDDVLSCQARIDPSLRQVDNDSYLGVGLYSQRLAESQAVDRDSVYFALNEAAAALWIIGQRPLLGYLDDASAVSVRLIEPGSEASGAEILVTGEFGRLKLSASRASGWLPQSFELVKERELRMVGGRVTDIYAGRVTSMVWSGEASGFTTDSESHGAPTELHVQQRTNWKAKPVQIEDTMIDIENVRFNPELTDRDFEIDIAVPVEYPVTIMGAAHLPYKWNGREAVPGTPNAPQRPNKLVYTDLKDPEATSWTQTVLVVLNILIFAAALAVVLLKNRRAAS